uniref:Nerve growth factor receptor n=1 Tax=Scleropages formosus TaxID=113540 RepID=A0A8C9S6L4_SCLFO
VCICTVMFLCEPLSAKEPCESGQYTAKGDCCIKCPPGEGVLKECGAEQTVCTQCQDSEEYSDIYSLTQPCLPCTQCKGLMRMLTPCTDSNNAVCVCEYGYYLNEVENRCEPCTVCPRGKGVLYRCEHDKDTICEECTDDTYSDQESSMDPCLPCTICEDNLDSEVEPCTPMSDAVCHDLIETQLNFPPSTPPDHPSSSPNLCLPTTQHPPCNSVLYSTPLPPSPTEMDTTASPSPPRFIGHGLNENLIPIYCSILAAVVVGLIAFIIFKRWNSCKQNKQGANNRAVNQTASAEGEKLHSDSGISVDSQSLQEHLQGPLVDGSPSLVLPPNKNEELERLLGEGNGPESEADWRSLAGLLGYQEEHIAAFRREERPVRALLSNWAEKDCASLEALCAALRKMDRDDIVQCLNPCPTADPTATSAV